MNEQYDAEINFEATWTENQMLNTYDPSIHWNPLLYIENLLSEKKETITYTVSHDDGDDRTTVTEHHYLKGSFWERLELHNFPVVSKFKFTADKELTNFCLKN